MTVRPKFTKAQKHAITNDWATAIPHMRATRPMLLVRRHGPFIIGICLKTLRADNEYTPAFFHTPLAWPDENKPLSLCGLRELRRKHLAPYLISSQQHPISLGRMLEAAKRQFPVFFQAQPRPVEVLEYVHEGNISTPYAWGSMLGELAALYFLKIPDLLEERKKAYLSLIQSWPEDVTRRFDGTLGWCEKLSELCDVDKIAWIVERQVAHFELKATPDIGFDL